METSQANGILGLLISSLGSLFLPDIYFSIHTEAYWFCLGILVWFGFRVTHGGVRGYSQIYAHSRKCSEGHVVLKMELGLPTCKAEAQSFVFSGPLLFFQDGFGGIRTGAILRRETRSAQEEFLLSSLHDSVKQKHYLTELESLTEAQTGIQMSELGIKESL